MGNEKSRRRILAAAVLRKLLKGLAVCNLYTRPVYTVVD